jgi:hypothetical protein
LWVCRTGLHVVDGEFPNPRLPIIPGHEIVGRIDEIGSAIKDLRIGERTASLGSGTQMAALGELQRNCPDLKSEEKMSAVMRADARTPRIGYVGVNCVGKLTLVEKAKLRAFELHSNGTTSLPRASPCDDRRLCSPRHLSSHEVHLRSHQTRRLSSMPKAQFVTRTGRFRRSSAIPTMKSFVSVSDTWFRSSSRSATLGFLRDVPLIFALSIWSPG